MRGQAFVTFPSVELAHHALVCPYVSTLMKLDMPILSFRICQIVMCCTWLWLVTQSILVCFILDYNCKQETASEDLASPIIDK